MTLGKRWFHSKIISIIIIIAIVISSNSFVVPVEAKETKRSDSPVGEELVKAKSFGLDLEKKALNRRKSADKKFRYGDWSKVVKKKM